MSFTSECDDDLSARSSSKPKNVTGQRNLTGLKNVVNTSVVTRTNRFYPAALPHGDHGMDHGAPANHWAAR